MVSIGLLLGLTLVAAITDLRRRKVYNWNTYPGILLGLIFNTATPDGIGLEASLAGLLVCGLLMLVCRAFFPIGGGDVKLFAMLGAFLGVQRGLEAVLWTCILGSMAGCLLLIWQIGVWRLLQMVYQQLYSWIRFRVRAPITEAEARLLKTRLYLAPASFLAVLIVCFAVIRF